MSRSGVRPAFLAAILAVLATALYAGTVRFEFPFDDNVHVVDNLDVRQVGRSLAALVTPTWPGYVYRPLPIVSYGLTHALFGLQPWAYHATNVLLNAAVVVLAYVCLLRLVPGPLAFVTALLFAFHPLHVEVVASIANRTELFTALFGLAALAVLLPARAAADGPRWQRVALASCLLLLALLAKESALVFLPLAALCLWMARDRDWTLLWRDRPVLVGFATATAVYLVLRVYVLGAVMPADAATSPIDNPLLGLPAADRVLRAAVLLGKYVALGLVPATPSADYSWGTRGLGEQLLSVDSLVYAGLLVGLLIVGIAGLRRRHVAGFFVLWFLLAFAITANLVFPIGTIFADRLAYLPSLGICGLVACALLQLRALPVRATAISAIVLALALRTVSYSEVWHDSSTVFGYEIATSPESVRVQNAWAESLSRAGRLDEARRHFQNALEIHPGYTHAAFGLGVVALKKGDPGEGARWLEHSLEIDPEYVRSLVLLGRLALHQGRTDQAGSLFARALNVDQRHYEARLGLLAACLATGNLLQAEALHAQLAASNPSNDELRAMSRVLAERLAASRSS
jgi:protein O-mannosyl-transferase